VESAVRRSLSQMALADHEGGEALGRLCQRLAADIVGREPLEAARQGTPGLPLAGSGAAPSAASVSFSAGEGGGATCSGLPL
jgi:hypothetical protein